MTSQLFPMILFGIATAFSPGPNNIMTSYTAFNFGVKKAIPTMLGVIIGWTLLIILLQLGSVSIFQKSIVSAVFSYLRLMKLNRGRLVLL